MARATRARRCALRLLGEARRRDARARDLLRSSASMDALDARDRAFASRLVLGTMGALGFVDGIARRHVSGHVEPVVLDALRMSAYEALFMATPASVVVSQGVELVRGVRPRAAGLANAVLRKVVAEDVPSREMALGRVAQGSTDTQDLAQVSGYPSWLLDRVRGDRGDGAVCAMACCAVDPAPVYVTANLALRTGSETYALLANAGLEPASTDLPDSFVLGSPSGLASSGLVESTDAVVADLSAQHVALMVAPMPNARVLEVGQGRGTKTLLLQNEAIRAGGPARIIGVDAETFKVRVAARRMRRAGLDAHVSCVAFDACALGGRDLPHKLDATFDLVFVDAPCSGTGTLRRHPEIAWGLSAESLDAGNPQSLPSLQLRMLAASAARVRVGGRLCYATCSVLRAENEDVLEAFLASEAGAGFTLEGRPYQSIPTRGGPDGHFCVSLLRSESAS